MQIWSIETDDTASFSCGLLHVAVFERWQTDLNLTLQSAIESARNSELMKRQQGTIRSSVKSYDTKAVRRETSRLSKDKGCPCCGGYRTDERSRCPANYSCCFKRGKLGYFKKACLTKAVKSSKKAPTYF